jgi:hypothetical protein
MKLSHIRKLLLTVPVLGVAGALAGFGAYSAFTATTTNTGNSFASGTVAVSQHAGSTTLYSGSNKAPSDSTVSCVRVTYTGSLSSAVKLYVSSGVTNGTKFTLKVERGSGLSSPDNTMNCTGFTASSTAFNTTLDQLGTAYGTGLDGKASGGTWAQNDSVDYRFTITVNDDSTPNAHSSTVSTGSHTFTWEADSV